MDNSDIDILIVYAMDPRALKGGGGIRYAFNLLCYLKSEGVNVKLMGVDLVGTKDTNFELSYEFIPVLKHTDVWWKFFIGLFKKSLSSTITKGTVVHVHRTYFAIPFILFRSKNPIVCTLHMKPLEFVKAEYPNWYGPVNTLFRLLNGFCLKKIDSLVAISNDVRDVYVNEYPFIKDKISTISGTGVDTNSFIPMDQKEARNILGLPLKVKIILFVGRLEKIKNVDLLLQSLALVRQSIKDVKLLVVGKGTQQYHIHRLVKDLDLDNYVIFLGEIALNKMPLIYSASDILALSSLSEASPTVIREAMACGIPTISTDVGDVRRILTAIEYGLVVEEAVEDEFSKSIIKLLEYLIDNQEISREKCREKARGAFSFNAIATQYAIIYTKLRSSD